MRNVRHYWLDARNDPMFRCWLMVIRRRDGSDVVVTYFG